MLNYQLIIQTSNTADFKHSLRYDLQHPHTNYTVTLLLDYPPCDAKISLHSLPFSTILDMQERKSLR